MSGAKKEKIKKVSTVDMLALELHSEKIKNSGLEIVASNLKVESYNRDLRILELQKKLKEREIYEVVQEINAAKGRAQNCKEEYNICKKGLQKKLKIKSENWGFSPDDGTIIEN